MINIQVTYFGFVKRKKNFEKDILMHEFIHTVMNNMETSITTSDH